MFDTVHVALIDDDEAVLDSLRLYLSKQGLAVTCFSSADRFLSDRGHAASFACVVADVRMPGLTGLDLVRRLVAETNSPPVVLITGHGDIDMAVTALKLGAADFIEKPFDEARLLDSIKVAAERTKRKTSDSERIKDLRTRAETLTDRQRQVMDLAVTGMLNKQIAERLGISARTVEVHRAFMMTRMGASNLAALVRMDMELKAQR